MTAFYNEFDPYAAAWLRNLIAEGLIPAGDVDERDIREVKPDDLKGYTQVHFFAGIGGWPLALRLAGWPDDEPVWTGSCPCQPLSSAGKQKGHADERHLWPAFYTLIKERRPATIFGEQVASKDGREWLCGVRADLEALGYAVGAADLCAASARAPHIRQRLWWVADTTREPRERDTRGIFGEKTEVSCQDGSQHGGSFERSKHGGSSLVRSPGGVGNSSSERWSTARGAGQTLLKQRTQQRSYRPSVPFWPDFDLIPCADGKARRVEPGTFPLVDGLPRGLVPSCDISPSYAQATAEARTMRLKGYGNAIVPAVAAEFVMAFMGV